MSVVITASGNHGPFKTIDVLADRLRCDGTDLPFSVIGEYTISEDDSLAPVPPAPAPVVPKEVTSRQATEALIRRDQYDAVIAILNDPAIEPDPVKRRVNMNEFLRSQVFERDRPLTVAMGAILGIDLDEWFIFASGL